MERRRLWEGSCPSRDAVLWTSFTWEELKQQADAMGFPLALPAAAAGGDPSVAAVSAIHRACDTRNAFSERVDALLEETHRDAAARVALTPPDELAPWITADLAALPVSLAAWIWSVVSDPREAMRSVESGLLWRLHTQGLRTLAFGRVELIEV